MDVVGDKELNLTGKHISVIIPIAILLSGLFYCSKLEDTIKDLNYDLQELKENNEYLKKIIAYESCEKRNWITNECKKFNKELEIEKKINEEIEKIYNKEFGENK